MATSNSTGEAALFSSSLISPSVLSALPSDYTCRPLQPTDYKAGFLDVLRVLTTVGDISESAFSERFEWMKKREGEYFILVIVDGAEKIVGTGALIVERKFIHNLGLVGHIEDIAVAKDQQGKKLGLRIIQALDYVAEKVGCYKVGGGISDFAAALLLFGLLVDPALTRFELTCSLRQTILDCSEANEGFYVKCGFKRAGLEMAHYYEAPKSNV
jgi:glucosamine-phosphate N-acetyltransferase